MTYDGLIETVVISQAFLDENKTGAQKLIRQLEKSDIRIFSLDSNIFHRLSDTETPQGLMAIVKRVELKPDDFFSVSLSNERTNVLLLDRVQDPGNVGTLIRTADAAEFQGIIVLKGTADIYSPKVVRAAAGSILRMPVLFIDQPQQAIRILKAHGKRIFAATPYSDNYYYQYKMESNTALIIGNEGGGVSQDLISMADYRIKIPMNPSVDSLNAAVAAAILMYETVRQKYFKD